MGPLIDWGSVTDRQTDKPKKQKPHPSFDQIHHLILHSIISSIQTTKSIVYLKGAFNGVFHKLFNAVTT
jgi:hypothetical protein